MLDKATNIEIKKINRNNIYRIVLAKENTSKQEIAYQLKISIPTVTQNLNELIDMGLARENGSFQSTGGRKAKIISSNPTARVALGLDITPNHVNLIMVGLDSQVLKSQRYRLPFQRSRGYYTALEKLIQDMVKSSRVSREQILGVGVSLPAIIGSDGKSVPYAPLFDNLTGLYEELGDYINYSYHFMNDANAGGFAEFYGNHSGRNVLYLSLSNSVGGAVCMNGKLYYGEDMRSGEFGHMTLVPGGRQCYCGNYGCVDSYCSALLLSNVTEGNLALFFERLTEGDPACKKAWEEYLYYLVIVINNLNVSFDCEVLLGGYVGRYLGPHLDEVRERAMKHCNFHLKPSSIQVSRLNQEASAMGAALYYIDEFISQI
ncbi:MAG: ROK family transcriptional regulator [Lachnospiraceae bacterium]|nr:ROK family transcriptional regulator [Lachnospiraceae bacterium]MCI9477424.1 ROK family transcriptional regulator [Lachnospiraceae bacterium]